ncbi:tRNA 2-thiocytidine biosynthesis TtcA family protein [Acetoanaerobium noterae]|jgi:tRNA(Ile)-lysidine synthase TilS/MesJ|uniref:tRNA 2-thiocytidine biosynthesis TtcA family protein n=2 Tax=Acetoanaerobium noterae TaxID=745369 RepID=UPI001B6BAB94|nr:tRNA 2-thiocytidine biosynthesis protein TtcA [Acetoanaerobium sp.]MBP9563057.1 tRNA 2-thiocytidine biosynthesis protein TtcA [Acetoanaerobium sp.]
MSELAGNGCEVLVPFNERRPLDVIERSIIKTYRKGIWSKFLKALNDYEMIQPGDRIAVAISGGKDSMLMAKLFQELQKFSKIPFEVEYIAMDPGYHPSIKELMMDNFNYLNIPIKVFETDIFKIADKIAQDYPCYMCAKMRRGALYNKTKELGCNKLALGHHFNDVIETTMLNMLYTGTFKTMLPRLKSTNFEGLELIRPLYYVEEVFIERFTQTNGIWPLNCACMVAAKKTGSKRKEMKELIANLKKNFNNVDKSIFKAAENVNLDCVLGWQQHGESFSFLDEFDSTDE